MNDLDILLGAPEDASPRELAEYLDEACGADHRLRQRVEEIIAAGEDESDARLRRHPVEEAMLGSGISARKEEASGALIGNYKLLQEIGKGGFGLVFMAEQLRPVKRRVALKLIKLGMDTKQVVARFEVERQALALMDHPNIARVYDAGASESGRPYFVMELVRGISITKFCEEEKIDTKGRLNLFLEVLSAIQHAHQKGIVHRDLKPSNVLVTMYDDKPVAKVIDFGVAKATQCELADKTLFTRFEQFIGTPAYMSPEQAQMSGLDIDTRSDIYSLGVLLYELMTGTTPFDSRDLSEVSQDEIRRIIREVDPPRPSTRLTAARRRANRHGGASFPVGRIEQDLDWIVMKALEKDRSRRYETASEFAADLRRFLQNEAVEAGAPGVLYRFQKYARRHRKALVMAGAFALFLIMATVVSSLFAIDAGRARDEAKLIGDEAVAARDGVRLSFAEAQLSAGKTEIGIAHLARLIREKSSNHRLAADRLMSVVRQREFHQELFEVETYGTDSVALSHDGDVLLVARKDGTAEVWDTESGRPHPEGKPMLANQGIPIEITELDPNGNLVLLGSRIAGSRKSSIHLWDWKSGELKWNSVVEEGTLQSAKFSPGGKSVLIVINGNAMVRKVENGERCFKKPVQVMGSEGEYSPSGELIVFSGKGELIDARTGEHVRRFSHGEAMVFSARFSPDESKLVTSSADRTARIWDLASGNPKLVLNHEDHVMDACFGPDGSLVATASIDGKAKLWEAATGLLLQEFDHGSEKVLKVAFTADAKRLVTETWSEVRTWNLHSGDASYAQYGKLSPRNEVRLCDDPELLLISEAFRQASLWRIKLPQPRSQILRHQRSPQKSPIGDFVWKADFSADGNRIISAGVDQAVRVWDSHTSEQTNEFLSYGVKWHAGFSPDQTEILIARREAKDDVKIEVRDAITGKVVSSIPLAGKANSVVYSPQRNSEGDYLIAVAPMGSGEAYLFNSRTGDQVGKPLPHGGHGSLDIHALCDLRIMFSPDGGRVVTGTDDGSARVFAVPGGDMLLKLDGPDGHREMIQSVRFSPDGNQVITASGDGTARVWEVVGDNPGGMVHLLEHGDEAVSYAEFSPDGRLVLTSSIDGTAKIWDVESGTLQGIPAVHRNAIRVARFSPDSRRYVTASLDYSARIWDAKTGHALTEPLRHEGGVVWANFDPAGNRVVTAGTDTTVRVWDVPVLPDGDVPSWLADWAEVLSGWRMTGDDALSKLGRAERREMKERLLRFPDDGFYVKSAKWFYSDKSVRPITPFSRVSVPQWVENRVAENSMASLGEALLIDPDEPTALFSMVKFLAEGASEDSIGNLIRARHLIHRARRGSANKEELSQLLLQVERKLQDAKSSE